MAANRSFVDTNVIAYLFDASEPDKRAQAKAILESSEPACFVSTQVLIELHSVLTGKLGMSREDAFEAVETVTRYPVVPADTALVMRACATATRNQLSIFEAMIVEAAAQAGCDVLLTEDLSDGQVISGVRVQNPFV